MSGFADVDCPVCGDRVTVPATVYGTAPATAYEYDNGGEWKLSSVSTSEAGLLSPYTDKRQAHGDHTFWAVYRISPSDYVRNVLSSFMHNVRW